MPIVLTRATKLEARYKALGGSEHCSACRFYMPQGTCGRIIGPVSPEGWCKYYSREAVQRWSNPGYAGGGPGFPAGASLDLSFLTPGTLDPRITFTRASTATYTDASGTIQTAATNAPRWDYDPVSLQLRGLLLEDQRQNQFIQSVDLGNAIWGPAGIIVTAPVATSNQIVSPDGTMTGARIVYPQVIGAGAVSYIRQTIGLTAAAYTISMWLRGSVGGEQIYITGNVGAVTFGTSPRLILTTSWQRYSFTFTGTATAWSFGLGTDLRDGSQTTTPAQTIYAWGAQVEAGAFPTSYIPTTAAAVTRAVESCTMPVGIWFSTARGTYAAEFNPNGNAVGIPSVVSGNAGSPVIALGGDSRLSTSIRAVVAVYASVGPLMTFGAVNKAAFAYNSGANAAAVNGTSLVANVTTFTVSGTLVRFGADGISGTTALNGWLRRVTYWPRVLTDAEMQQVTT